MSSKAVTETLKNLDERVIAFMNKFALPGMCIGVVQDGKLVYGKGFGEAEAESKRPVTDETVFRIASISKTFTAIAVMQLFEQGKFKLDDPVNDYLKTYQVLHPDPNAPAVTIRHLLTHTSGIGEMRDLKDLALSMVLSEKMYDDFKEGVPPLDEYFEGLLAPDVYPEKKWAYANNAFATLGQLIEDVSGESFEHYMVHHVFEPLGMQHSDFTMSERVHDLLAQGYIMKKGLLEAVDYVEFPGRAAGTAMSNVQEMGLYLAALMNGGANANGTVIKPETLKKMMSPFYREDPHLAAMGLGFFLEDLDGHTAAWHGGSLPGFNSALWVAPDDKLGVFVSANANTRMIYHFGKAVLRDLIGLEPLEERLPKKGVAQSPFLWKDLVGTYQPYKGLNSNTRIWMTFGGEVEIYVAGGKLMMRSLTGAYKDGIELYPVDQDDPLAFENVTDGRLIQLAFLRNAEGFIDHLSISALSFYTFYKVPRTSSLRFGIKMLRNALVGLGALMLCKALFKNKKKS